MGRWFHGCPAYQSGPWKDGFRIDVSMSRTSYRSQFNPYTRWTTHRSQASSQLVVPGTHRAVALDNLSVINVDQIFYACLRRVYEVDFFHLTV